MKIEFENSIRRFSFLRRLPDIKIAWINPCWWMTKTKYVSSKLLSEGSKKHFSSALIPNMLSEDEQEDESGSPYFVIWKLKFQTRKLTTCTMQIVLGVPKIKLFKGKLTKNGKERNLSFQMKIYQNYLFKNSKIEY